MEDETFRYRTLVILKPECIENCIVGSVMQYFDKAGLRPIAMKLMTPSAAKMRQHYADVLSRVSSDIGDDIIKRMTRGNCIFIVYDMNLGNAVTMARSLVGATDPQQAAPETIRGHFGGSVQYNIVHASDSTESAHNEIAIWFPECVEVKQTYIPPTIIEIYGC